MKITLDVSVLLIALFISAHAFSETSIDDSQPEPKFQKLGVAKAHPIKIDPRDIERGNQEMAKVIENSSPEVKEALRKAAQELEEKK